MVTGLVMVAARQGGQDLTEVWGLDPTTRRGMVYGLILVVGAIVAIMQFQRLLGFLFKLLVGLLGLARKALFGFLRWNWKVLLELAAYLGYQGRRLLILLGCLAVTAGLWWMFGWATAAKFAAVWILFALTSKKRRALRQYRRLEGLASRFDELEKQFDKGIAYLAGRLRALTGLQRPPSAEEEAAERARAEQARLQASDLPFPEAKPPPAGKEPDYARWGPGGYL
jgi:hypothetical protein